MSGAGAGSWVPQMETTTVAAKDAPLGVQLWPTRSPDYAPRFTLAAVDIMPATEGISSYVRWTYESGNVRTFALTDEVAVQLPAGVTL